MAKDSEATLFEDPTIASTVTSPEAHGCPAEMVGAAAGANSTMGEATVALLRQKLICLRCET